MKILTTILALSIGLNITRFFDDYFNAGLFTKKTPYVAVYPDEKDCACNDAERYKGEQKSGGGQEILLNDSRTYINNYQSFYKASFKGAFISKKALDKIFCAQPNANGVFCYFGLKDANPANFTLVLEAGVTDNANIKQMESNGSSIFMSELMCPNICGASGNAE